MASALDLRVKRPAIQVDFDAIPSIKTLHQAIARCADMTGSKDKSLAADISTVDEPTLSRIKTGQAGVKGDFLERLMDACGNDLPLFWLCFKRGYDPRSLRRIETDVEAENRQLREEVAELKRERAVITKFVKETGRS